MESSCAVILLAGGTGSRMGGGYPKQLRLLAGKPLLVHSLLLFLQMPEVKQVVLVLDAKHKEAIQPWLDPRVLIATPGSTRFESMYQGLLALDPAHSLVCVHDAARPFLKATDFKAVCSAAEMTGAAALAIPVKATITEATPEKQVQRLLNRDHLWEMQTPQVVKREWLIAGYKHAKEMAFTPTDELSLIAPLGHKGTLVTGSSSNVKLTEMEDWLLAEQRIASSQNSRLGVYGIWIQNGKILLVEKGPYGIYAGKLDLPGGGIEFGEAPEETLVREWQEEVGLELKSYTPLTCRSAFTESISKVFPRQFHHLGLLYQIQHAEPHPTCIAQDAFAWHDLTLLNFDMLTPFAAYALQEAMSAEAKPS